MLILTEPKNLISAINYLGDTSLLGNYKILNLNANISNDIERLDLMPKMGMIDYSSPDFDSAYISTIMNDEHYFSQFMYLMTYIKNNVNVFLLIYNEDTIFNPIAEVLVKLIQQRYGYNYTIAESPEEICDLVTGLYSDESMFTTPGIITFDSDYARYQYILAKYNPSMFINEKIDDSSY